MPSTRLSSETMGVQIPSCPPTTTTTTTTPEPPNQYYSLRRAMKIQLNQAAADAIVTRLSPTEERGDVGHHISDLTACLRKRWLDHNKPADGPNQLALTFLRGSALHQLLSGEASE